jgi:hypothetical protein
MERRSDIHIDSTQGASGKMTTITPKPDAAFLHGGRSQRENVRDYDDMNRCRITLGQLFVCPYRPAPVQTFEEE